MNKSTRKFPYPDRFSFLWLTIAFLLTIFSTGKLAIPLVAWLSKSRIAIHTTPTTKEPLLVSTARIHEFRLWLDR